MIIIEDPRNNDLFKSIEAKVTPQKIKHVDDAIKKGGSYVLLTVASILDENNAEAGHFIVVFKKQEDDYLIYDPTGKYYKISKEALNELSWYGTLGLMITPKK